VPPRLTNLLSVQLCTVLASMTRRVSTTRPTTASSSITIIRPAMLWRHCSPPVTWPMTSRWTRRRAPCTFTVGLKAHMCVLVLVLVRVLTLTSTIHLHSSIALSLLAATEVVKTFSSRKTHKKAMISVSLSSAAH